MSLVVWKGLKERKNAGEEGSYLGNVSKLNFSEPFLLPVIHILKSETQSLHIFLCRLP
jgi:hypothetical protein